MITYAIGSAILISLISILVAIPLLIKKKISKHTLLFLLSISVGAILSTVFFNFIPEIIEHEYTLTSAIYILIGFILMFIIEKFIHWKHTNKCSENCGHAHAYSLAPINIIGDGVHNFIDGLVIAGAYATNITLGIATTISIIFHEVPQEIADFGVLLYSGWSKKKAIIFNLLSALTAIVGTIIGLILAHETHHFTVFMLPLAAGNFLYIAASNLLPQLHRHCKAKDTFYHLLAIAIGIAIILAVTILAPHAH